VYDLHMPNSCASVLVFMPGLHLLKTKPHQQKAQTKVAFSLSARYQPCNEEDLALVALVKGHKVEIEDGVSAVVVGQRGRELRVPLARSPYLVDDHRLGLLVDLEHDVSVNPLPLHLHEPLLALLLHLHPLRRLHLEQRSAITETNTMKYNRRIENEYQCCSPS